MTDPNTGVSRRDLYRQMRADATFLLLDSVPFWLRGRWYIALCRWQMRRWHPDLREDR